MQIIRAILKIVWPATTDPTNSVYGCWLSIVEMDKPSQVWLNKADTFKRYLARPHGPFH